MATWIALFRGINVGGNNILRMKDLLSLFQELGFADVQTYIQSGNVIFNASNRAVDSIAANIAAAVKSRYGFEPKILLMTAAEYRCVIDANPFRAATDDPKTLHCFFLAEPAEEADLEACSNLKLPNEEFVLSDRAFYLSAPGGVGRSKLAQRVEKLLGVPTSARNWRTVMKIDEIARQIDR